MLQPIAFKENDIMLVWLTLYRSNEITTGPVNKGVRMWLYKKPPACLPTASIMDTQDHPVTQQWSEV